MADARVSKTRENQISCGFDSLPRHQILDLKSVRRILPAMKLDAQSQTYSITNEECEKMQNQAPAFFINHDQLFNRSSEGVIFKAEDIILKSNFTMIAQQAGVEIE